MTPGLTPNLFDPPTGRPERVFLDWDGPFLPCVVTWLHDHAAATGTWDLARTMIVLPGARAVRTLQSLLVERAERDALPLDPPLVVTPAHCAAHLLDLPRRAAPDAVRRLAWLEAVRCAAPEPSLHLDPADFDACRALATLLERTHRTVARAGRTLDAVTARVADGAGDAPAEEAERWSALARLERAERDILSRWGFACPHAALLEGRARDDDGFDHIVLAAVPDLGAALATLLARRAGRVTALIMAPPDRAAGFDDLGRLNHAVWREAHVPIDEARLRVVEAPAQQAEAALAALATHAGDGAHDHDIVIGLPDETLLGELQRRAAEHGARVHAPTGSPLDRSTPARTLAVIADFIEALDFETFAELLRAPDVEAHLLGRRSADAASWLGALDRYRAERLPRSVEDRWTTEHAQSKLEGVRTRILTLLEPLRAAPDTRPIAQWIAPIATVLGALYENRTCDLDDPRERTVVAACDGLLAALEDIADTGADAAPMTAAQAVRFLLDVVAAERVPEPADPEAIELVGWLDLALETAEHLIVTGVNEGVVPRSAAADPLLPDRLRGALEIPDGAADVARDAYLLSAIQHAHATVTLVLGRISREGDPLVPSRLLFRADDDAIVRRVRLCARPEPAPLLERPPMGLTNAGFPIAPVTTVAPPLEKISVTAFGRYLRSPYRFYVDDALHLRGEMDDRRELAASTFGSLVHKVLERYGGKEYRDERDPERIGAIIGTLLDDVAHEWFGAAPAPPVVFQLRFARRRLESFAAWQAKRRAAGWRIEEVEHDYKAPFDLVNPPVMIVGKIDRVDVHEETGVRQLLDYKTKARARTPEQEHRVQGAWINLQLPLYRRLYAPQGAAGAVLVPGFVALPKDTSGTQLLAADWDEDDYDGAERAAADVIARIRAGAFSDPGNPYSDPWLDALIGRGFVDGAEDADTDDEDDEDEGDR